MPSFYFDVCKGEDFIPDDEGFQCISLEAAEHEAIQTALQLGRHWLPHVHEVSVMVRDDQRRTMLAMTLALTVERLP